MPTIIPTDLKDVILIEPTIYEDHRGYFYESYNETDFQEIIGRSIKFTQDNHATSIKNALRGLHYQLKAPQAKLIRVLVGEIYDVAIDLRKSSPTFGKWTGHYLSAENKKQIWVPEGFAHGYLTLSKTSEIIYKVSGKYDPTDERTILWEDPALNIDWPLSETPILSDRDKNAPTIDRAECCK